MKNIVAVGVLSLGTLLLAGCTGKPAGPEVVNVEGKVLVDGEPMENLRVEFHPQEAGRSAAGKTDASGHFVLEAIDGTGEKGAVVGTHGVVIRDLNTVPEFLGRAGEDVSWGIDPRISTIYANVTTSGLRETVSGARTDIEFDIKPWDPDEAAQMREDQKGADAPGAVDSSADER